jgi:hypothetical protein
MMLVLERTVEAKIGASDFRIEVLRDDGGLYVIARAYQEVVADTADGPQITALDADGKFYRGPFRVWVMCAARRYPSSDSAEDVIANELAELRLARNKAA